MHHSIPAFNRAEILRELDDSVIIPTHSAIAPLVLAYSVAVPLFPFDGPMSLSTGSLFGEYRVRRRLGAGGIATVYAVQHRRHGTWHALKVLQHGHHGRRAHLLREAELQSEIGGPIVPVEVVIDLHGYVGNLMPLVEGCSLFQLTSRHRTTPGEAMTLFFGLVRCVDRAHCASVVHNDLKPSNVLLTTSPSFEVRLVDFGLALRVGELAPAGFAGTPAYASPERLGGSMVPSKAGDLWSLGVILYELLAGYRPFAPTDLAGMRAAVLEAVDLDPIPDVLQPVLAALLEPVPEFRLSCTAELLDALEHIEDTSSADPTRPRLALREDVSTDLARIVAEAAAQLIAKVPEAGVTMFPEAAADDDDRLPSDQGPHPHEETLAANP